MADLTLSDMMESYRSPWEGGYQAYISSKYEYAELASNKTERLKPGRGKYYKHQIFSHRFFRIAKRVMVNSRTGTGKSCEVFGFTDYALRQNKLSQTSPDSADPLVSNVKQCIVLVPGRAVEDEMKNQIICKCTDETYEKRILGKATEGVTHSLKAVTQVISEAGYVITTPESFVRELERKLKNDEKSTYAEYNDTIFVIDEMDGISISREKIAKIVGDKSKKKIVEDEDEENVENPEDNIVTRTKWTNVTIWEHLYKLFNSISGSWVIGMTATPMVNTADDIVGCLGLLLPSKCPKDLNPMKIDRASANAFFPTVDYETLITMTNKEARPYFRGYVPLSLDLLTVEIEDFEPYLRGRILYTRELDTGVDVQYMGERLVLDEDENSEQYHQIVYPSVMSDYQEDLFYEAFAIDNPTEEERKQGKKMSLNYNSRNAVNFVYKGPGAKWGVKKAKKKEGEKSKMERVDIKKFIKTREDIAIYSCKTASILDSTDELGPDDGNVLIITSSVHGSGIESITQALEIVGYKAFEERKNVFEEVKDNLSYCQVHTERNKNRKARIPKAKRYAVLSGDIDDFKVILNTMNAYENRHGDYIKIIIVSKVAQVGVNIKNISHIHVFDPPWNQRSLYQGISRAVRADSHIDLVKKGERFKVKVYQHVAVTKDGEQTIDGSLYAKIEEKDIPVRRMMRFIKRCNMSCIVNKERNMDVGEDGSPDCDYEKCDFECFDESVYEKIKEFDYSTYNISFSTERIEEITRYVIDLFGTFSRLTLDEMIDKILKVKEYDAEQLRTWILFSLEILINDKVRIINRFGFHVYIIEDNGTFYVDKTSNGQPNALNSWYSENMVMNDVIQLQNISDTIAKESLDAYTQELKSQKSQEGVSQLLYGYPISIQAHILESSILNKVNDQETKTDRYVIHHYRTKAFGMHEPVTEIKRYIAERDRPKRGRKRKEIGEDEYKAPRINVSKALSKNNKKGNFYEVVEDKDAPYVYIHIIYSGETNNTRYAGKSKGLKASGRIRILDTSKKYPEWKDIPSDTPEYAIYNIRVQFAIWKVRGPYDEKGVYGYHDMAGTFMLAEHVDTDDLRKKTDGAYCPNIKPKRLLHILSELSGAYDERETTMPLPKVSIPTKKTDRKNLAKELGIYESDLESHKQDIILKWKVFLDGQTGTKKDAIDEACTMIEKWLIEDDRMV